MKRFLALILAIAMVATFVPTAFAAENESGNGNEWIFNVKSHNFTEDTRMYNQATAETAAWVIESDSTNVEISDKWGFSNQASLSDNFLKKDYIYINFDATTAAPAIDISDSNRARAKALSLELNVDTAGEFFPKVTYITDPSGAKYELYLINKKDKSLYEWETGYAIKAARIQFASLDSAYRIGTINTYGNREIKTATFPKKEIEIGEYYLVIVANGVDDNWKGDTTIKSGKEYASLKLVAFAMKDYAVSSAPFYKYDIKKTSLSDSFATDYATLLSNYSNAVANGMLRYISWEATASGISKAAVDAAKTDGFALTGRNYKLDTSPTLYDDGFGSHLKVGVYTEATKTTTLYFEETYNKRPFCLIKINVPTAGKYKISALNAFTEETAKTASSNRATIKDNYVTQGAVATVHITKATVDCKYDQSGSNNYVNNTGSMGFSEATKVGAYDCRNLTADASNPIRIDIGTATLDEGEYYVFFDVDSAAGIANSSYWNYKNGLNQLFLLSGIELTPMEATSLELDSIQSAYNSIVNEDGDAAVETALATGNKSFVKIFSAKDKSLLYNKEHNIGDIIEYKATGDDFLYWAQGMGENKTVISEDASLSLKAEKGAMYIYAVYANDAEKTEVVFYNANKSEISRKGYDSGAEIEMEALPSMAGFEGSASAWVCVEDGTEYTNGTSAVATGKFVRFVAKYPEDATESFTVSAVNGSVDNASPLYGELVTVTAPLRKDNTSILLFNYWEKDGEIASFDESYSFRVYKDTVVTAVYKEYRPIAESVRKIILGTRNVGDNTAIVAEFINVTDTIEKGILFGGTSLDDATHKIAMKTDGNTFSVIDDVTGDAIGYAILANGNVIYSK